MNIFITILISIAAIIILLLLVALFTKKKYGIVREILIDRKKNDVFDYIKYLKNQEYFSKWATLDPEMKKSFRGTDGQAGFVSAWESNNKNVGMGEQEITEITEGSSVNYKLRFIKPFKSVSSAFMTTESMSANRTKVRWGFDGKLNYPMNIMLLFMNFDKMIGDDFVYGLLNLKQILEEQQLN